MARAPIREDGISLAPADRNPITHCRKISGALAVEPQLAAHASIQLAVFGIQPVGAPLFEHNSSGEVA